MLKPITGGWAVQLTDGREVARFIGPAAKRRALRYLAGHNVIREQAVRVRHMGDWSAR
jgi:hypothetical protein